MSEKHNTDGPNIIFTSSPHDAMRLCCHEHSGGWQNEAVQVLETTSKAEFTIENRSGTHAVFILLATRPWAQLEVFKSPDLAIGSAECREGFFEPTDEPI